MPLEFVQPARLLKDLSERFARKYGSELPVYKAFSDIVTASNTEYLQSANDEIDPFDRVAKEKHGAVRIGTVEELKMVTEIFAVFGMEPVEHYDLTQIENPLPINGTAFRSTKKAELDVCAFKMFTSMLDLEAYKHPQLTDNLRIKIDRELNGRRENNPKFSARLQELLQLGKRQGGFTAEQGDEFIDETVKVFAFDKERIFNYPLYKSLRLINDALADIVCIGMNLNHLTPRAYDIDDVRKRLVAAGYDMKDGGREGPPILASGIILDLVQDSIKAPGEWLYMSDDVRVIGWEKHSPETLSEIMIEAVEVNFRDKEEVGDYLARIDEALLKQRIKGITSIVKIKHRARFGEIESRGVALTEKGEEHLKSFNIGGLKGAEKVAARENVRHKFPQTHEEIFESGLGYYTFKVTGKGYSNIKNLAASDVYSLVRLGYLEAVPQTYNDFLPMSAAGIYKSNMSTGTAEIKIDNSAEAVTKKIAENRVKLEKMLGRGVINRHDVHKAEQAASIISVYRELQLPLPQALKLECEKALANDQIGK